MVCRISSNSSSASNATRYKHVLRRAVIMSVFQGILKHGTQYLLTLGFFINFEKNTHCDVEATEKIFLAILTAIFIPGADQNNPYTYYMK